MRKIWESDNHCGVGRVYLALRKQPEFAGVNHKKVRQLIREMGLQGIGYNKQSHKYDSSKGPEKKRMKNKIYHVSRRNGHYKNYPVMLQNSWIQLLGGSIFRTYSRHVQ